MSIAVRRKLGSSNPAREAKVAALGRRGLAAYWEQRRI